MGETKEAIYWPELCGHSEEYNAFWSWELTVNTSSPDLTSCFQNTVLVWVPCGLLWLMTPLYGVYVARRPVYHSWTSSSKLSAAKLVDGVALALLSLVVLIYKLVAPDMIVTLDSIIASLLLLLTFVLVTFLEKWFYGRGIHTSGLLLSFWFLALVSQIIVIRSMVMRHEEREPLFAVQCIQLSLIGVQFVLGCFSDKKALVREVISEEERQPLLTDTVQQARNKETANPCPKATASALSKVFFSWFSGKVAKGIHKKLEVSDIWDAMDEHRSDVTHKQFNEQWKKELGTLPQDHTTTRNKEKRPRLVWALLKAFGPYYLTSSMIMLVNIVSSFIGPQILNALIAFIEGNDPFAWKGYLLAAAMYVTVTVTSLTQQHHFYVCMLTALRVRAALTGAIYRKALSISNTTRQSVGIGAIVNMVAVDLEKAGQILTRLNFFWATPLIVIVSTVFLWQQIGPSCLTGVGFLVIILPTNFVIVSKALKKVQRKQMLLKDKRMKLTSQVLAGIKVLKLYAWEPYFKKQIEEIRRLELTERRKALLLTCFNYSIRFAAQYLVTLLCFMTYVLSSRDHVLDAQKTFVSMSLINLISFPLGGMCQGIAFLAQVMVSVSRVEGYLLEGELDAMLRSPSTMEYSTQIEDGQFAWDKDDTDACLKDINLKIRQGELVAVVGAVGCGKSALLMAMLGEMQKLNGKVDTQGSVAYVPQEAWIQNLTLRDNVLFTSKMDKRKYSKVIQSCALGPDLDTLPGRDLAEIGERGINLSGGQKQRVSLARAAYSDGDIYLLDDPLSAVDAHVGQHLFEHVLGPTGLLKDKTRIFVTHTVQYLPLVDNIIVMKDGRISEAGTYEELVENDAAFAEFLRTYLNEENVEQKSKIPDDSVSISTATSKRSRGRSCSGHKKAASRLQRLIETEDVQVGRVKLSVLKHLMKAAGWLCPLLLLLSCIFYVAVQCLSQLWLSDWSKDKLLNGTQDQELVNVRLGVYGGLAGLQILSIAGICGSVAYGSMLASYRIHRQLLDSIFHCPMSFFDTNPLGRILNRFARDMDVLDQTTPDASLLFLLGLMGILSIVFVALYSLPVCALVIGPLAIVLIFIQRVFIICACQLQRLDAVRRSPVFAFLGESIGGAVVIRAYGCQERFTVNMNTLVDTGQSVFFEVVSSYRWLSVLLQLLANLIVAATAVFGIMSRETINSSTLGMTVSFTMQIGMNLHTLIRMMCELETQMVCVERIKEYSQLESEASWKKPEREPPKEWPENGAVTFLNYQTRYRPGLDLVLRGINCQIHPREKVGLVGRTGAGKSSFTLALFRLLEADDGIIQIDGRDISKLGLHDLRRRIAIIPQDPVLFTASLRFNLDPSEQHSDLAIWNALQHAHLKPFVESLPDRLQHQVVYDADGGNLSVGQKQLVCLARALLRMPKILVLDEATAAVDMETDELIQSTIRSEFNSCTVITIAHRLNTVLDYDRVMVMENGFIVECDSPVNLLGDSNSKFYGMAKDAGVVGTD